MADMWGAHKRAEDVLKLRWQEVPPPEEPRDYWRVEFKATEDVAKRVMAIIATLDTEERHFRRINSRIHSGGGDSS